MVQGSNDVAWLLIRAVASELWHGVWQARLVMRSKGQLRLLMNANLWPEIKVTPMDGGKVLAYVAPPC